MFRRLHTENDNATQAAYQCCKRGRLKRQCDDPSSLSLPLLSTPESTRQRLSAPTTIQFPRYRTGASDREGWNAWLRKSCRAFCNDVHNSLRIALTAALRGSRGSVTAEST